MKRVLSVLMICALLMVGLTTFVAAEAASIAITVDKTTANAGDTVTAYVRLRDYAENSWSAMTIKVAYDDSILAFEGATSLLTGEYVHMEAMDKGGHVVLCWIGDQLPAPGEDEVIATVTFTVQNVEQTADIQLTTNFVADGMVSQGTTEKLPEDGTEYVSGEIESELEVPEEPDEPATSVSATILTNESPNNTAKFDATGKYIAVDDVNNYKIIVTWSDTEYVYSNGGREWDPGNHKWLTKGTAGWSGTGSLSIENHSGQNVTATFDYEGLNNDTVMTFKNNGVEVPQEGLLVNMPEISVGENITPAGSATVTCTITGGSIANEDVEQIGTITVTIE